MKISAQRKLVVAPVEGLIRITRGQKIMLDSDLSELFEVTTKALNQAVRRNIERFPDDFMFQLSLNESASLRSQTVILEKRPMRSQIVTASKRNIRYQPLAFTEHGVVMLASVLKSQRAVQMSLLVVRAFIRLRELVATNKDLAVRIEKLEKGHEQTGSVIEVLIEDIDKLSKDIHWIKNPPLKPKHRIGFFVDKGDE